MTRQGDVDRTAVRILGLLGGGLVVGLTLIALLQPDSPRDTDGVFTVLGTVIGAIGGIAASRSRD